MRCATRDDPRSNIRRPAPRFHAILAAVIPRTGYLDQLATAVRRSPVTALLGPRQSGKTTLARQLAADREATYFDLESEPDRRRIDNPEMGLGLLDGLS